MKTAQFLFRLGIIVMVVDFIANLYSIEKMSSMHAIGLNGGAVVATLFSSLYQGGLLIGVAKILEKLHTKGSNGTDS